MSTPSPTGRLLAADLAIDAGRLTMPTDRHEQWLARIDGMSGAERAAFAVEIVALALHVRGIGGADAEPAVISLGDLAYAAVGGSTLVEQLFGGATSPAPSAVIGLERARALPGQPAAEGSVSLFAARLASKTR